MNLPFWPVIWGTSLSILLVIQQPLQKKMHWILSGKVWDVSWKKLSLRRHQMMTQLFLFLNARKTCFCSPAEIWFATKIGSGLTTFHRIFIIVIYIILKVLFININKLKLHLSVLIRLTYRFVIRVPEMYKKHCFAKSYQFLQVRHFASGLFCYWRNSSSDLFLRFNSTIIYNLFQRRSLISWFLKGAIGVVVRALDYQSRDPMFQTTGWI